MPQYPANQPIGFSYAHIYGAGTTQVRAGGGLLQSLIVNVAPSGGTVTLYNNTVGSGAAIAAFTFSAGVAGLPIPYGINFGTGLTVVTTGSTTDLTVIYR
jgi:hypothetical protein